LEGIVQDTEGNPITCAQVYLTDPRLGNLVLLGNYQLPVLTDIHGHYSIGGINRYLKGTPSRPDFPKEFQPVDIWAVHDEYTQLYHKDVRLDDLLTSQFNVSPIVMSDQNFSVSIHVDQHKGSGDISLDLAHNIREPASPGYVHRQASFNFVASYTLEHIRPGSYRLDVQREGCALWRTEFRVLDQDVVIDADLREAYDIRGFVKSKSDTPFYQMHVTLWNMDPPTSYPFKKLHAITQRDGSYIFQNVPSGAYSVTLDLENSGHKNIQEIVVGSDTLVPTLRY
ncbi:MAG: carboxypeptidase-like regulatory domain-containing protein, partial [Nanoarchaeota archaeon]